MTIFQNKEFQHIVLKFYRILKAFFIVLGIFFLLFVLLSFSKWPYMAYRDLGQVESTLTESPEALIVYSAAGMPDPNTLMRIYTCAIYANKYPNAKVFIAYPVRTTYDSISLSLLSNEFSLKGISSERLLYEVEGTNTYKQTKNISKQLDELNIQRLQIITSPEHLYRAVACFKKLGFNEIGSVAALEQVIAPESLKDVKEGIKIGESLLFRYNMWSYMKYEITVLREYFAIAYYKLKGWI